MTYDPRTFTPEVTRPGAANDRVPEQRAGEDVPVRIATAGGGCLMLKRNTGEGGTVVQHSSDKVIGDLELLRDDAITDEAPTSAMWLDGAIAAIRERDARIAELEGEVADLVMEMRERGEFEE